MGVAASIEVVGKPLALAGQDQALPVFGAFLIDQKGEVVGWPVVEIHAALDFNLVDGAATGHLPGSRAVQRIQFINEREAACHP